MELTKEKIEELLHDQEEYKKMLKAKDVADMDALEKEKLDKLINATLDVLEKKNKSAIKPVDFSIAPVKQPVDGVEYKGLGDFMQMVRCQDPRIANLKTAMSTTSGQGGYTIPTNLLNAIINELAEQSKIYSRLTPIDIPAGLSINLNSLLTDVSVAWSTEATNKNKTKPTFSQDTLSLKFIYAIITMTKELQLGTAINMDALLKKLVAQRIALEIENQVFNGAAAPFTGLLNAVGVNAVPATAAGLIYDDLVDTLNNTGQIEQYKATGEWFLNRTALALVMKLKDNNNRPLWELNNPLKGEVSAILGRPYTLASQITTTVGVTTIYYGPIDTIFKGRLAGNPDMLNVLFTEVAVLDTSGTIDENLFQSNKVAWRLEQLIGLIVGIPAAWVRLTGVK